MKRKSREITLGKIKIGGDNPPVIQTMITTPLNNLDKAVKEAETAYEFGCKVVRTAYKKGDKEENLKKLIENFKGEIIADIHFDYKLAMSAIDAGVSGIRINPGNIGGKERVSEIIEAAKKRQELAIRIGVNGGSLEKDILEKHGEVNWEGLVESSLRWADFIENELGYKNFKISAKSSNVTETVLACRKIREHTDAPLHVGITEAGGGKRGIIKSSAGISVLLFEGLADTFRVSLTDTIEEEIKTGFNILKSLGLLENGIEIIGCPTCGRTHGEIIKYYNKLEKLLDEKKWWLLPKMKVALMGCEVNGPGEAKEADIGIALGNNCALYFEKGEIIRKFNNQDEAFEYLAKNMFFS
jgi:(E)-4-hydroxy-3-methylbut-2-enyl-diphosphate synthase